MADKTTIEWADASWNPVTGCTRITAGCDNCYAERQAERFRGTPGNYYEHGFDLMLRPAMLIKPVAWKKPRMIFVNSMSDLFHKEIPVDYIAKVFDVMETVDRHTYQVLTKRSSLMRNFVNARYQASTAPKHIWLGVSVENDEAAQRIVHLQQTNAAIRFLSIEPLLAPVGKLNLDGIAWVIVGGESGPHRRPMDPAWARDIRDQCITAGVAFFFKQWGGRTSKSGGRSLDGREWDEYPAELHRHRMPDKSLTLAGARP